MSTKPGTRYHPGRGRGTRHDDGVFGLFGLLLSAACSVPALDKVRTPHVYHTVHCPLWPSSSPSPLSLFILLSSLAPSHLTTCPFFRFPCVPAGESPKTDSPPPLTLSHATTTEIPEIPPWDLPRATCPASKSKTKRSYGTGTGVLIVIYIYIHSYTFIYIHIHTYIHSCSRASTNTAHKLFIFLYELRNTSIARGAKM